MIRGTILALATAATAFAPSLAAAASAPATASAVLVRPLSLVKTDDLEFGTLVASATAGTATVNPVSDVRTTSGGVIGVSGATPSAAHFTAAGVQGLIALIALPGTITLTRGGGAETMTVTAISSNGPTLRVFPASPTIDIAVAGTLNVAANQVAGSYVGSFVLNVLYF